MATMRQFGFYRLMIPDEALILPALFLEDFELSPKKSLGIQITVSPKDKLK